MSALLILTITSCNGNKNPLLPGIGRLVQSFQSGTEWAEGYSIDSSSTLWIPPLPTGGAADTIAVYDLNLNPDPPVETLVTAFVRHTSPTAPSDIKLILLKRNGEAAMSPMTISAPPALTGNNERFCRHPSVEVTYSREAESDEGQLEVQVVWSQLTGSSGNQHWDLYYKYILFDVDEEGVDWSNPYEPSITKIYTTISLYDELQPDLCVDGATGDLYVVFNRDYGSSNCEILVASHTNVGYYTSTWQDANEVSATDDTPKIGPRIDAGPLDMAAEPNPDTTLSVATVWCEPGEYSNWQIMYNRWDTDDDPEPNDTEQISMSIENGLHCYLPQIDIVPTDNIDNQAIITWTNANYDDGEYYDQKVMITATPFMEASGVPFQDWNYTRCSDVAGYEGVTDAVVFPPPANLFGISYYHSDDESDPGVDWSVEVRRYSYTLNWQSEIVSFSKDKELDVQGSTAYWSSDNPFTGSTLTLRIPAKTNVSRISYSYFGLGWINDDGCVAELTQGTID